MLNSRAGSQFFDPVSALERRVQRDPSSPLVTYYDCGRDERVELSARSFANWVDKTVNFFDELEVDKGSHLATCVFEQRPGHWVGLVWVVAAWQYGAIPALASALEPGKADLLLTGPHDDRECRCQRIQASLTPFALPCADLADGAVDYADVLAQPDHHWKDRPCDLLWVDEHGAKTKTDLDMTLKSSSLQTYLLVTPSAWEAISSLASAVERGRVVIVTHGTDDDLNKIALIERVDLPSTH